MTQICTLLLYYVDIILLILAVSIMTIIFIRTNSKEIKIKWLSRALIIPLLLFSSIFDMFLVFSTGIRETYNYELVANLSNFISLIASAAFITLVIARKHIVRFLEGKV